jgi:hypothetical protein
MLSNIYCTIRASDFLGLGLLRRLRTPDWEGGGEEGNNTVGFCMISMELSVFPPIINMATYTRFWFLALSESSLSLTALLIVPVTRAAGAGAVVIRGFDSTKALYGLRTKRGKGSGALLCPKLESTG